MARARTILEGVLEETGDKEVRFKLRTALQLLEIVEEQQGSRDTVRASTDLDEQTRQPERPR